PALGTAEFPEALRAHFPRSPSISIDHAVMEKSRSIAVIPCEFGWSDLGTVAALSELFPADASGNALRGEALAIDSCRNVVWARPGKAVALVGCEDLVVIDTEDASSSATAIAPRRSGAWSRPWSERGERNSSEVGFRNPPFDRGHGGR